MVDLGVCGGSSYIAGSGRLYLPRVNGIGLNHRDRDQIDSLIPLHDLLCGPVCHVNALPKY